MKSALNGGLNLSVLDGWWEEAYDGSNGWAISGDPTTDAATQDARDAAAFYGLLENEVTREFYDRDESGVPKAWVRRIKASLKTVGPMYSASRMMGQYLDEIYRR
jgi:starch phosphorylase